MPGTSGAYCQILPEAHVDASAAMTPRQLRKEKLLHLCPCPLDHASGYINGRGSYLFAGISAEPLHLTGSSFHMAGVCAGLSKCTSAGVLIIWQACAQY